VKQQNGSREDDKVMWKLDTCSGPGLGLDLPFVAPVDLGLGAGEDLEPAVEPHWLGPGGGQASPVLPDIDLDPLVVGR
jgi:hypothetical protein